MNTAPPSLSSLVLDALADLRRGGVVLLLAETVFKLFLGLAVVPLLAVALFHLLRLAGRSAVTNEDLLGFLLSPTGVLAGLLLGLQAFGLGLLEHACVLAIARPRLTGQWKGWRHALGLLAVRAPRILHLALLLLVLATLLAAPFALLAALVYAGLLGGHDINFYLAEKPPRFLLACGLGGLLLLAALALAAWLYLRWVLSLPIVLYEKASPLIALRQSAERGRGLRGRIAVLLLGWQILALLGQLGGMAAFRALATFALASAGERTAVVVPTVAGLLIAQGLLLAVLSSIAVIGHCLLIFRVYLVTRAGLEAPTLANDSPDEATPAPTALTRLEWAALAVVVGSVVFSLVLTLPFDLSDRTEVTAHRGLSRAAPENSLSAIRGAIDVGADRAEIDVQLTRDGEVILLHDADLKRVAGDPRRPGECTLAQLRQLDIGSRFDSAFTGERIPTLREVVALARGKIRLNIELKFYGSDHRLARAVADILRDEDFAGNTIITSFDYPGVRAARDRLPSLAVGVIVTAAVGDLSRLDVEILSLHRRLATDTLIRRAHRLNRKVHVWGVGDRRTMQRLMDHGVDGIITDEPELFLALRKERADLGPVQRLLLACRQFLE